MHPGKGDNYSESESESEWDLLDLLDHRQNVASC